MNNPLSMMSNMMGGGGFNPMSLLMSFMSGNTSGENAVSQMTNAHPELKTAIQFFQAGNSEQGFQELSRINPQAANALKGKTPQELQSMAGQLFK